MCAPMTCGASCAKLQLEVGEVSSSVCGLGCARVCAALLLFSLLSCPRARAFGGSWASSGATIEQASAAVLFVDDPGPTITAVVQLQYSGPAEQLAWLIPVNGTPTVALSSNAVFQRLDLATAPEYWVAQATTGTCAQHDDGARDGGADGGGTPDLGVVPEPTIMIAQGAVGPYEYVNVAADPDASDPAQAAIDWLSANGYALRGVESKLLAPYLKDGMHLLAFKLAAGHDPGAIRPVMITYEGERPVLPLRPAAVAAQANMGITVWVLGPSQAVPDNYKSLVLDDALIDWQSGKKYPDGTLPSGGAGPFGDYVIKPSNYDALVSAAADEAGGQGFVTELGAPASQFRERVWSMLDQQQFDSLASQQFEDGLDALIAVSGYRSWDGWDGAVAAAVALPDGVSLEQLLRDPAAYRGEVTVDGAKLIERLREDVIEPVAAAGELLFHAPYLTRLFTTMSADEMTLDPSFDYNPELAQVSNVHFARQVIDCGDDGERNDSPWRMQLPQGGVVVGQGDDEWPLSEGSLPANLKVVELSTSGSGKVVTDNSAEITEKLADSAGKAAAGTPLLQPPRIGLQIGGSQTLRIAQQPEKHEQRARVERVASSTCGVVRVGSSTLPLIALWGPALGLLVLSRRRRRLWLGVLLLLLVGCGDDGDVHADNLDGSVPTTLTREQLRDPETCKGCHPTHYREWSGSMHAYAAQDPVFLAMNERGQRETHGALGDFCIKCHAPMAVRDGLSKDGLNLEHLPDQKRGVSCYFCHNVTAVEGDHNGMLKLADDTTMRGPIKEPLQPGVHRAEYSELYEDTDPSSTALCGSCHDIVTQSGVHLERTFQEYRAGIFSKSATGEPPAFDSCLGCHMGGREGFAAVAPAGVGLRTVHEHLWPGVDVPLTDFPHRDALRSAVEECQLGAPSISFFNLEATPPDLFTLQLETNAGHNQPSGAAQDRRMWLEFSAYDENGELLADQSSGRIADGQVEELPESDPRHDPQLTMFRDRIFGKGGEPVHMFWDAAASKDHPDGYESHALPVSTTTYIEGKHAVLAQYRASGADGAPARVTARLRMRPIGRDVLEDLVESGDLDPAIADEMPTFTLGAQIEWTPDSGWMKPVTASITSDCSKYRCLLDPTSRECQ